MLLTKLGQQAIYSAPPYAMPLTTTLQSTSRGEVSKIPRSWPCIYSETKTEPAMRYGSAYVPLTDPHLVVSRPFSLESVRKRPEASHRPSLREMSAKWTTSQMDSTVGDGTATHLQCPPVPLGNKDSKSWTLQDSQTLDPKGPATLSPQVSILAGTLGGITLTGTDCMLRGMVSNSDSPHPIWPMALKGGALSLLSCQNSLTFREHSSCHEP